MSRARRWIEAHAVSFPLPRAALLLVEAAMVFPSNPDAACTLVMAAADAPDNPAIIRYGKGICGSGLV